MFLATQFTFSALNKCLMPDLIFSKREMQFRILRSVRFMVTVVVDFLICYPRFVMIQRLKNSTSVEAKNVSCSFSLHCWVWQRCTHYCFYDKECMDVVINALLLEWHKISMDWTRC